MAKLKCRVMREAYRMFDTSYIFRQATSDCGMGESRSKRRAVLERSHNSATNSDCPRIGATSCMVL